MLTERTFQRLAELQSRTLAMMHGSVVVVDGARVVRDLAVMYREVLVSGAVPP